MMITFNNIEHLNICKLHTKLAQIGAATAFTDYNIEWFSRNGRERPLLNSHAAKTASCPGKVGGRMTFDLATLLGL